MQYPALERVAATISLAEFTERFAAPGRPVVIEGAAADWAAARRWTVDMLCDEYASRTVTVARNDGPEGASRSMTLEAYRRYMRSDEARSDPFPWYLASWRFVDDCPTLRADFEIPPWFADNWLDAVDEAVRPQLLWMFIGPARAGSWLHLDIAHTSAWNVQLTGRKRWLLFPPADHARMGDGRVNAFDPDLKRFPDFAQARGQVADASPGDIVFTPSLWWHQTVNLEEGIAVTANYADVHNCREVLRWLETHPLYLASHGLYGLAEAFRQVCAERARGA